MKVRRILRAMGKDRETGWRFTIVLCLIYLAYLVWMHAHHEMWRDEVHAWTLARLANGFWDIVTGDRVYEGHPPLWFWYLRVWSWFVQAAWGIQAATVTAAMAAAVLFVRFAPFPRYLKVLALFSFYLGFEYTVMARNYVLGWLCVCLFCALYHPLRVRHLGLALVLALMSLTSVFGLIMSICLLGFVVLDQVSLWFSTNRVDPPARLALVASPWLLATVISVSAAILFCVLTIDPPDPNPFSPGFWFWALTPKSLLDMLFRFMAGFLPWRSFSREAMFTTYAISHERTLWVNEFLGVAMLVLALLSLARSWRLVLVYLAAVATMDLFMSVRWDGSLRHWGHFVMLLMAGCWLLRTIYPRRKHWISTVFLAAVLVFQFEAGAASVVVDTTEVFSGGRDTAAFIVRNKLQDLPIVAGPEFAADTVAGYLRRPFFAHETEEINQTVVFHGRRKTFATPELVRRSVEVAKELGSPVLLISTQPLPEPPPGTTRTLLFSSRPGVITEEVFQVYRVEAR